MGEGGSDAPRIHTEYVPQTNRTTTITVVICITRSALSLDSSMPLMFCHQ